MTWLDGEEKLEKLRGHYKKKCFANIWGGNGYIPIKHKSPKVTHLEAENLRGPIKILTITTAV